MAALLQLSFHATHLTNVSDIEVVEKFYESLSSLVRLVLKHNFQMITGDINAG